MIIKYLCMTSARQKALLANNAAMVFVVIRKTQIWHVCTINCCEKSHQHACICICVSPWLALVISCVVKFRMRFICFSGDICDFVDSHYHHLPNEGGVSTSVPKAELTEGTYIDVISNLTPIYYKLLLTIVLSL